MTETPMINVAKKRVRNERCAIVEIVTLLYEIQREKRVRGTVTNAARSRKVSRCRIRKKEREKECE